MNILIIEDEERNFNRLKRLLEKIDPAFRICGHTTNIVETVDYLLKPIDAIEPKAAIEKANSRGMHPSDSVGQLLELMQRNNYKYRECFLSPYPGVKILVSKECAPLSKEWPIR